MKSRMGNKLCPPTPHFFLKKHDVWNKQEILALNHFFIAQHKHSKSQTHVSCYLQLKFQQTVDLLLDAEYRNYIPT